MTIRYDNRVAVITGAGSGLGRSHALFLASRGAKVVVNDLGGAVDGSGASASAGEEVVDEIKAAGGEAVANADSVATPEGAANIIQTAIDNYGQIDILINNAGNLRDKSFAKLQPEDFDAVVDVHLSGSAYCTLAAWPHMKDANYGRIVMTTSSAGLFGNFGQGNYAAAKMGVFGLMNALKHEGRKFNININTLAPMALTRMTEEIMSDKIKPLVKPEFVTPIVAWFCAEENTTSGDVVEAGAGYYAKVQIVEGAGVVLGGGEIPTPEEIQANYDKITDMSQAAPFDSANDIMRHVFRTLRPR
ncbi:MAG: SDR family oxidoreductase [Gammaproteobacteria bacterium]|nr:SDR family oxidoreductase [Gammaproteobacteria bacterium]MBQ0839820.1 SDR family oxidoreductase [Gammaproteobacteria bacterium]